MNSDDDLVNDDDYDYLIECIWCKIEVGRDDNSLLIDFLVVSGVCMLKFGFFWVFWWYLSIVFG